MESFHWGRYYETEIASVDAQHHKLVELINELGNAVTGSSGRSKDLEAIIGRLADYAKYHFADEEASMESAGLDPRHIRAHKTAHHHFLEKRVVSRTEDLLKANQTLEHLSLSDPLTDLPNRR